MNILTSSSIADIKTIFSNHFPGLKIEFYRTSHNSGEGSVKADSIADHSRLSMFTTADNITLPENPNMSVVDFENYMRINYGLFIQVFRRSGDVWLQTTSTDNWSLSKQQERSY